MSNMNYVVHKNIILAKTCLLKDGVRLSSSAYEYIFNGSWKVPQMVRSGMSGGLEFYLEDIQTHLKVAISCQYTTKQKTNNDFYCIIHYEKDKLYLTMSINFDYVNFNVYLIPKPSYYSLHTTSGKLMSTVVQQSFSKLSVGVFGSCSLNSNPDLACKFCAIGTTSETDVVNKTDQDIIETLTEAYNSELRNTIKTVMLGGGTPASEDRGAIRFAKLAHEIKIKFPDWIITVMMFPPSDKKYFTLMQEAGITEISMNIEFNSEEAFEYYIPGKNRLGRAGYLSKLKEAVSVFGKGNVQSIVICGLETLENTEDIVRELSLIGVIPVISLFRSFDNIPPVKTRVFYNFVRLAEMYELISSIVKKCDIFLGPKCIDCQCNTLSFPWDSPLSEFNKPVVDSITYKLPNHIDFNRLINSYETPFYLLDINNIQDRIKQLKEAFDDCDIFYSMKANPNIEIMRCMFDNGIGIDACSLGDLYWAIECGFESKQISYTGLGLQNNHFELLQQLKIHTNIDSYRELVKWKQYSNIPCSIGLRVISDVLIDKSTGPIDHCSSYTSGGKFGISLREVYCIMKDNELSKNIDTIHMHVGSGNLDTQIYIKSVERLLHLFIFYPQLTTLNIGGGFGTSYNDSEVDIDIEYLALRIKELVHKTSKERKKPIKLQVEPGEFLVASAGYLVTKVITKKNWIFNKEIISQSLIVDSSANQYLAAILYNSNNRAYTLNTTSPIEYYSIYGITNQSGDKFGPDRSLPRVEEGDCIIFGSTGAYSAVRQSNFNELPMISEIVYKDNKSALITKRQTVHEIFNKFIKIPNWG